jgi:hypothetical protein
MQAFKIDHFKDEWPDRIFPEYRSLDESELSLLQDKLFKKFIVKEKCNVIELFGIISSISCFIDGVSACDDNFSLSDLLSSQGINYDDYIYLNWYRFDDIDVMRLSDLDNYFHDIWYPHSDDIDIFDKSYSWILSVRHDGVLSIYNQLVTCANCKRGNML